MRSLTNEEVDFFHEQGFLAVADLLSADELSEWRDVFAEALAERGEQLGVPGMSTLTPSDLERLDEDGRNRARKLLQMGAQHENLTRTNGRLRKLCSDPALISIVDDLFPVPMGLMGDQAIIKAPYSTPTFVHWDGLAYRFDSQNALAVWVALDDVDMSNGCMYYLPGSHKAPLMPMRGTGSESFGALILGNEQWAHVDMVPCPVPAGGATFHHAHTTHAAGANMTSRNRRALVVTFRDKAGLDAEPDPASGTA